MKTILMLAVGIGGVFAAFYLLQAIAGNLLLWLYGRYLNWQAWRDTRKNYGGRFRRLR